MTVYAADIQTICLVECFLLFALRYVDELALTLKYTTF